MSIDFLKELYRHMDWADSMVWSTHLKSNKCLDDDVLQSNFLHLHLTQQAFLEVWNGRSFVWRKREEFSTAEEFQLWISTYYPKVHDFLAGLDTEGLERPFEIPWAHYFEKKMGIPVCETTMGESVYQVVAHSMYHRGQLNRRIRELGEEPPTVDFVVWAWAGKPEAVWK